MKKIFLILILLVFVSFSFAQSPIYTTAGYGANYSSDGAYLGWNISGGGGETNFVNNIGGGTIGGFTFDNTTRSNVVTHLMNILANGNVGIGTTSPVYKLVVSNAAANGFEVDPTSANGTQTAILSYNRGTSSYTPLSLSASSFAFAQGNVGIGTITPPIVGNYGVLALNGRSASQGGYLSLMTNGTETGAIAANTQLNINTASGIITQFYTGSTPTLQISSGGNVLINQISQANTAYKLDVNGSIRSNAIVVNTTGADFVFNGNYHLHSLGDLERYIEKNHHLPEIKSAEEMQKEGMNVGELNTKLLQKVEELTLYLIDKDKQIERQQMQLSNQLQINQSLQDQIDQLKKQLSGVSPFLSKK